MNTVAPCAPGGEQVYPRASGHRLPAQLLPVTVMLGVTVLLVERIYVQLGLPLWLDETWTAVIAGQPRQRTGGRADGGRPHGGQEPVWHPGKR